MVQVHEGAKRARRWRHRNRPIQSPVEPEMLDYPEQRHRKSQAQQKPDELFDLFFRLKRFDRQEKQKRIRAPSQQIDFCQIWINRSAGGVLNKRYTSQPKHWDKQPIPEKL